MVNLTGLCRCHRSHVCCHFQMFLHDLLKQCKKDSEVSEEQLITYADTMVFRFVLFKFCSQQEGKQCEKGKRTGGGGGGGKRRKAGVGGGGYE